MDDELEIKAYYAGHVLGAAMFHVRVGQQSLVYTVSRYTHALGAAMFHVSVNQQSLVYTVSRYLGTFLFITWFIIGIKHGLSYINIHQV